VTTKKIDSMTPEQEAVLVSYRQEWLDIGRSTQPIDLIEVEQAITDLYEIVLDRPKPAIVYCQSPWQLCVMPEVFKELGKFEGENLGTNLETNLWTNLRTNLDTNIWTNLRTNLDTNIWTNLWTNLDTNLRTNLWTNLRTNLRTNLVTNLRTNLGTNLETNLWTNLDTNIWTNLWTNLRTNLDTNLRTNLRTNLETNLWTNLRTNAYNNNYYWLFQGSWGLYWLAFYEFPDKFIKPMFSDEDRKKMQAAIRVAKCLAGFVVYDGICFVSERPTKLTLDDQGRLHNETGPALEYFDGYYLYSWHGTRIDNPDIIEKPITIGQIEAEQNAEIKRIMMERFGWSNYLQESKAELIDQYIDQLGNPVKLWKKELGENFEEPLVMIELVNSTIEGLYQPDGSFKPDLKDGQPYHKKYMFAVPPEIKSAKKAHLYHCGLDYETFDEIEFVSQT
jgi:hypothetical protein